MAENDGANPHAREESVNHDQLSSVRPSSAVQRSGKSTSQDHDDPLSPSTVHGSTPLSQIGAHPCAPVNDMYLGQGESQRCRSTTRIGRNIGFLSSKRQLLFLFLSYLWTFQRLYSTHNGSPARISFIDDSSEYLRTISDRIYLEEAGYWGLVALRERENAEYADVLHATDKKYLG